MIIDRVSKAILFSDVKGFSTMSDEESLIFCDNFFNGVNRDIISKYKDSILLQNTWGDALHMAFNDVPSAGFFALEFRDWIQNFDWQAQGLNRQISIRIALHVGVVSIVTDPIINGMSLVGKNTSKAARIEPITCENQVFVSGAYAAMLALHPNCGLSCTYVGMRQLPKKFGEISVYLLQKNH